MAKDQAIKLLWSIATARAELCAQELKPLLREFDAELETPLDCTIIVTVRMEKEEIACFRSALVKHEPK